MASALRNQCSRGKVLLLLLSLLPCAAGEALAQSALRSISGLTEKRHAPNMKDMNDFLTSNNTRTIPMAEKNVANELRTKTIESIISLLKNTKGARRFELILRLGQLYEERADYYSDVEVAQFVKAHEKWAANGKQGKQPRADSSASTQEMTTSANVLRQLVSEYTSHPQSDVAMFTLAKVLARLGNDNAVLYYQQLIQKYPKSGLIANSHLILGEHYFDKHNIEKAIFHYRASMEYKDNPAYPYAVYKLGWAFYNREAKSAPDQSDNYKRAGAAFKLVVELSKQPTKQCGFQLRQEALKDLVMVWADAGDVDGAWRYFKGLNENESFYNMLERLGWIYSEQGKRPDAIQIYTRLLREAPLRPNSPEIHAKLVALHEATENMGALLKSLEDMQKLYSDASGPWHVAHKSNVELMDKTNALLEKTFHFYGASYHQRGEKSKNRQAKEVALAIYRRYLIMFPKHDNAYEIRYYTGEILYDFDRFAEAAREYLIVSKEKPQGKYRAAAAFSAVGCANQLLQKSGTPQLPPPGQAKQPIALPEERKLLVETVDHFAEVAPNDKRTHPMVLTAANIFFDFGQYPEAMKRYEAIVLRLPDTQQAKDAIKIILGFHFKREAWDTVIDYSRKFIAQKRFATGPTGDLIVETLRQAMFGKAHALEKAKKYGDAGDAFLAFRAQFPDYKESDRAVFNAVINFGKAALTDRALEAANLLLKSYPRSTLRSQTLIEMANTYESIGEFESAAVSFKMYADEFSATDAAPKALFNAALIREALGQVESSQKMLQQLVQAFPKSDLADEAMLRIAKHQEHTGRIADALHSYQNFMRLRGANKDTQYHLATAKEVLLPASNSTDPKHKKNIKALAAKLAKTLTPQTAEARRAVAESLFKQSEPAFRKFVEMGISNAHTIEADAQKKQAAMAALGQEYETILGIGGGEYAVASLYRLGEMHENFSKVLLAAPAPSSMNQKQISDFKTEIEKLALPLRDEAQKFFEAAAQRAAETDVYSAWTPAAYAKMVDIAPAKYPAIQEQYTAPLYLGHSLKVTNAVAGIGD